MRRFLTILVALTLTVCGLCEVVPPAGTAPPEKDRVLFDFADRAAVADWKPRRLPEVEKEQPIPRVEIVPETKSNNAGPAGNCLKITFEGGDWPTVGTTKIAVAGNWKEFQTLKAVLTVDRPSVAYFRVYQGKADATAKQPRWEKTLNLLAGRNDVTLLIRRGLGVMDPGKGEVSGFVIGMFRPEKSQTLLVSNVRLGTDWPPPQVLGWYSPYNHDGYSVAATRDFLRAGTIPKFKVLGTELEVENLPDLAKRFKDKWSKPEPKTIEQVEAETKAEFEKIKKNHPQAVFAILRQGEQNWDPANPNKAYEGWKVVYLNCHGPSGPNRGREVTPPLGETVEVFMRHRSVLMRVDLASIPKSAKILAARLVVTRAGAADLKVPQKANMWVTEPCNREWDETAANCYFYAKGKHWKGVSGLYYGDDPDFWPVFLSHGPAGGAVSVWDFTEAIRFWLDGKHANHGFFLHGDSNDYMRMVTPKAKNLKERPAVIVVYEPKS